MRKKAKVDDKLEQLAVADARRAVDFAEVVVLLLDATRGLEVQDLKIANLVLEEGRALMIAINKWDVAEDASGAVQRHPRRARRRASRSSRACRCWRSRRCTGKGLDQMLAAAFELRDAVEPPRARPPRSTAGSTRRWKPIPPPAPGGRRIKLRYITQIKTRPPSFVVFGTRLDDLPTSYERYLVN